MSLAVDIVGLVLIAVGLFFMLVAVVGFLRLPDVFSRLHVTGILDTLGAPLLLIGVAVLSGFCLTAFKLVLGVVFLYVTSPLVGHLLSRSAIEAGYRPTAVDDQTLTDDLQPRDATGGEKAHPDRIDPTGEDVR